MELQYRELENGIRIIKLTGELDINGVGEIETKFVGHSAGGNARVLVDLTEVTFLASIGIRLLLWTAKAVVGSGGKFVLFNPAENVEQVLVVTGIKELVPIHSDMEAAISSLMGK